MLGYDICIMGYQGKNRHNPKIMCGIDSCIWRYRPPIEKTSIKTLYPHLYNHISITYIILTSYEPHRSGSFRAAYSTMLEQEEAKREFLLAALVKDYPNVVGNLTTKGDLTYRDLKERI